MRSFLSRFRPSPAMLVALIALSVAMGGTGYAATALKKNSVGSKQIKANSVTSGKIRSGAVANSDLKANAVDSGKILDGSVGNGDLANNAVNGAKVQDGSLGSGDVQDGSLQKGDAGAGQFLRGTVTVQRQDVVLADNSTGAAEAACPAGQTAIGGGATIDQTGSDDIKLMVSRPGNGGFIPTDNESFSEWRVVYRNPAGGTPTATIRAFVICTS